MKEECLICQAPLEYLETEILMECEFCHRQEMSKTRCVNGHYICDECHTRGLDSVIGYCLKETSRNPIEILERMMDMPFCHTHGPEHHTLVGTALLTAYHNAGGKIDLLPALKEMAARGRKVPGGACGFWGSCGAAISSGMFISIISGATPLSNEPWGASQYDDRQVIVKYRRNWRSTLLQKKFLSGNPDCCQVCGRIIWRFYGNGFHYL